MKIEEVTLEEIHLLEMLVKAKLDKRTEYKIVVWDQGFGLYYVNIGWGCNTCMKSLWNKVIRHFGIHINEELSYKKALKEALNTIINTKDFEENKQNYSSLVRELGVNYA